MTAPNVLFLSIDALRRDRTSLFGYPHPTTPNLDLFAQEALSCSTAISLAPFTQVAFVQMMTSSRPLSYGGYDLGAIGRPTNLFRQFKDAGYHTIALSTLHWVNRYFGYGDGIDEEHQLFVVNSLIGAAVATMRPSLRDFQNGTIGPEEMLQTVVPVVEKAFENLRDYAEARLTFGEGLKHDYPHSQLVCAGYKYDKIIEVVDRHTILFREDPEAYVRHYLDPIPHAHDWLAKDWRFSRNWTWFIKEGLARCLGPLLRPFSQVYANGLRNRYRSYVDAGSIANKAIQLINKQAKSGDKPLFLWAHFMDTHLPYVSGEGTSWYRKTKSYLATLGLPTDTDPSLSFDRHALTTPEGISGASDLYDAALLWTDEQVGRILAALESSGLADNTIVAIMGDHGEEFGEHGFVGHYFIPSENNIRVPMLFRTTDRKPGNIEGLVSHLDVAPTLAALAGIPPAEDWEGEVVTSRTVADRDFLIMETFFGGNCIFEKRPLYIGVRTATHKYFWKEYRDPVDIYSDGGNELYDLVNDPKEKVNLYTPDHPIVLACEALIAERLAELPEVSDERIIQCLGANGEAAVQKRHALKSEKQKC